MRTLVFITIGLLFSITQVEKSVSDEEKIEIGLHDIFQIDEPLSMEQKLVNILKEQKEKEIREREEAIEELREKRVQERKEEVANETLYASLSTSSSNTGISSTERKENSSEKVNLLARLVNSEARGEPYEGKIAVAEVVLNRMESPEFPNSMRGVIYQDGQFQVVSNGSIYNSPSETSVEAARQALAGTNHSQGALFFYNYQIATDRWLDTLPTITVIGQHTFK